MRTRNIFRYLLAIIIALGTTVNTMAQQKYMKIYYKQYTEGATGAPEVLMKGDVPHSVSVTSEGMTWATSHRLFEFWHGKNQDRLLADFKGTNTKESHLKLKFENFPFEVNNIQWNRMNDLFSGSITQFFRIYELNTICTPLDGTASENTTSYWDLNVLNKEIGFTKTTLPAASGQTFKGLRSVEIGEKNYSIKWVKVFGVPTVPYIPFQKDEQVELDANNRTFIKAGWNGETGTNSNINDGDNSKWAFRIRYTLPDIRMQCYYYDDVNKTIGQPDNNIIVGESSRTHKLQGYITAHAGAVVPTENPVNPEDFHFEYEADANKMVIRKTSGVIEQVKVAGDIPVTVKLMCGTNFVCSYTQTIHVYSVDPTRPEICIGFRNGYKGYDVTVYGKNWIEGYIAKYGKDGNNNEVVVTPTNDINDYHFIYSESSNGQIIKIDSITGEITARKEGDVEISAVLKKGTEIVSNTYTYTLHVFGKKEGLTWSRPNTYTYSTTGTPNNWKATTVSSSASYDWKQPAKNLDDGQTIPYLNVNTLILENSNSQSDAGSNNWKQIAWFKTTPDNYWRAVCQKISFKMLVPKYTKADGIFAFAGNVTIGETNNGDCSYGFEIKDLGIGSSSTGITSVTWNTTETGEDISSSSGSSSTTTIARKGVDSYYTGYVGGGMSGFSWSHDNSNGSESADPIRYLAVMAYLYKDYSYPGKFSVGYKGIPTYTYYATITYYNNDGTGNVWETQTFTSTSKTETKPMYSGKHNLTRNGYELLGWSTDPNATTAEYKFKGDLFCPYDAVNGGGKGPVSLYAVWSKIPDIVTLDSQGGEGGTTFVTATYGQPMPAITVPTRSGYEFYGYFTAKDYNDNYLNGGTRYYNSDGTSAKNWDKNSDVTLYAHWKSAKYIVTFDINGGIMQEYTQYNSDPSMSKLEEITDQLIKISFTYGHGGADYITNAKPKLGGFKCVGFYDADNVLVASVNTNPANYNITINKNNKYWKEGNWNWPHDVTFTARYEPKFTYENNVLDFGTETLEIGIDWSQGVIHDVVDAANYLMNEGSVSEDNPVMVVNLKNAKYLRGDLDAKYLKVPLENKPFFSPNLLVYLTNGFYDNNIIYDNLIFEGGGCKSLVVTDRFPIKIPYAFNASKASYARDAKVADDDKGKDQAKNSYWGTLCLPYPIRNNASGVKFYEFQSTANNYFMFEEMSDNEVIPANTPVLYCRTDYNPETVEFGSMITIKEQNVDVPKNATYKPEFISYVNAHESIQDWEFRGNLKTNVFCGRGYNNAPAEAIANSDITNNGEVYYFKQNKFTHLVPATTKNQAAGKMTLYPYRAYFYKKGVNGSSAKVSAYSILVVGEDGNTTDITDAIFGDGEGDGKIYDLNGIRVMQPVKGRLYIVNGQKKVYR